MAVASIKEAEIRPLFERLFKRVEEAMQSCTEFESLIGNFKSTLDPLQPWIKGERKGLEDLVDKECLVDRGIKVVGKFSYVQIWKYYRYDYTDQLVQLDRPTDRQFKQLIDFLSLMTKDFETCDCRQQIQLVDEMDRRHSAIAEKLTQLSREKLSEMLVKQEGFSEALLSLRNTETTLTVPDRMEEEEADVMYASLESAYQSLFWSIKLMEDRSTATIFKPLLGDLILTLRKSGKPERNDVKWQSKEELESFRVEMKNGAEMVRECCKVGEWASYNTKYKYINALLGLNQSLRRMKYVKFERVREDMVGIRNIEPLVDRVERALQALAVQI